MAPFTVLDTAKYTVNNCSAPGNSIQNIGKDQGGFTTLGIGTALKSRDAPDGKSSLIALTT